MSAWTEGSASGGRARSVKSFMSTVIPSAAPTASVAQRAAVGSQARLAASPIAPTTATRGHFTHQAEATTKTAVSGPQRISSAHPIAALSHSAS
jgi:hypothetical protein